MAETPTNAPFDEAEKPTYERSDRTAQKRSRVIRLAVLIGVLVFITVFGALHQMNLGFKTVGVDALCPFGGIETLWALLAGGALIQRIALSSVILLVAVLLTAFVFRRSFCGYICPLGALQELFGKIGKAIWKRDRPQVPAALDKPARFLKYAVLVFFTLWTWQAATLVIRPYDPWVAWMHLTSAELFAEFGIGVAVLGISLVGSVVYDRFFCKYLCPTGAFLGAISRLSLFKVHRNAETCTNCSACDKACPVNVSVSTVEVVNDAECINCNECVNVCPVKDTLTVDAPALSGRSLQPNMVLGITALLIAGVIGATTASGAFAWTIPTLSQTVEQNDGTINPEDIKGRMSFAEVSEATGIPPEVFETQFGVSPEDMSVPMKDIADKYGFDIHTNVREFVASYLATGGSEDGTSGAVTGEQD